MSQEFSRRSFIGKAIGLGISAGLTGNRIFAGQEKKEQYNSSWKSLDSHPCPDWYKDGKLGMYFHWGASAVPGWAPRSGGTPYAEWYWHSMNNPKNPTYEYHRRTYGENFRYDDFFPMFKAEKYDPDEWVEFAKNCGMKYIFVNSKHHDGYCLWPTKFTDRNAFKIGPEMDLFTPLAAAAKREGLKFGFYYSFYEWYNPLYTGKPFDYTGLLPADDFVDDFMVPQIRELVEMYNPDFLYFDGEWDHPPEFWKSRELVAWYYNRAAARGQEVMVNDRYGKGARGVHGDVFNVEYGYDNESEGLLTRPWSYWRGVAKTFGYNKDTDHEDCLSPKELIDMAVNGVALNGNFDMNVGPDAEGVVREVERKPLLDLGAWLRVNGEAIYGTRPWRIQADGDVRFTERDGYVYAVFLKWQGEEFRLRQVRPEEGSTVTMLGAPGELEWRYDGDGTTILFPPWKSRPTECAYAWAFKMKAKEQN